MKTIDSHSHFMPPEVAAKTAFFKQFWSDADGQLQMMDQCSIDQAVLLYPTSDAHIQMNGWANLCEVYNPAISKICAKHQNRFIGSGILPVDQPSLIGKELLKVRELGLKAISLASSYDKKYLDHELFTEVYEFAQKHGMPIHVHPQIMDPIGAERLQDPLLSPVLEYVFDVSVSLGRMMMAGVFLKFPKVNFIFAHYGGVLPVVKERFDTTYQMLRKREFVKDLSKNPSEYFKNLYFDTSGSKSPGTLQAALEVADPGHILFGSDYPANRNVSDSMQVVKQSSLTESQKESVLSGNILRLLS